MIIAILKRVPDPPRPICPAMIERPLIHTVSYPCFLISFIIVVAIIVLIIIIVIIIVLIIIVLIIITFLHTVFSSCFIMSFITVITMNALLRMKKKVALLRKTPSLDLWKCSILPGKTARGPSQEVSFFEE